MDLHACVDLVHWMNLHVHACVESTGWMELVGWMESTE